MTSSNFAIRFKLLRYKNFFQSGNIFTEIELDKSPTTLILGDNGTGKSTMMDALTYVLFKKPFRKVNLPLLVNTVNGADCLVEVEFSVGSHEYKVRRGLKPAIFEIYIDGDKLKQESTTKVPQQMLEEDILRVNYDSFVQIVLLGNANYTPFMQLNPAERRKFVEPILDINIFSLMADSVKDKLADLKDSLKDIDSKKVVIEEQVALVTEFINKIIIDQKKQTDVTQTAIVQQQQLVSELIDQCKPLNERISELNASLSISSKLEEERRSIANMENQAGTAIDAAKKTIAFYTNTDSCKTCGQTIAVELKNKITEDKTAVIQKYEAAISSLKEKKESLQSQLAEMQKLSSEIRIVNAELGKKQSAISAAQQYIQKLNKDLKMVIGNVNEETVKLNGFRENLALLESQRESFILDKHYYEVIATMLKDTGVKAGIIKQYVPLVNGLVNKYLRILDFEIGFQLNEEFETTFNTRFRETLSYYSFSEGQKLRIDLALLFAWRDIARRKNSCSINLLILDEIMDSSLDLNGNDYAMALIRELSESSNIFMISHRSENLIDKFEKVLRFKIEKFFSVAAPA